MLKISIGTGSTCKCGGVAACSGTTDTCNDFNFNNHFKGTSSSCYCGSSGACSGMSDTCTVYN